MAIISLTRRRVVAGGLALAPLVGGDVMAAEESPRYDLLKNLGDGIEIRRYAPQLLAEVDVPGSRDAAANAGFRILAAYIFGGNKKREEIAMTAPVTQRPPEDARAGDETSADAKDSEKIAMTAPVTQTPAAGGDNQWTVTFLMPSVYTMETLPVPLDARIRIIETPAYRAVAIRFSGRITDGNFRKHREKLDAMITARGLETRGDAVFAYYNGPMTPFFLRRNEVLYVLQDAGPRS